GDAMRREQLGGFERVAFGDPRADVFVELVVTGTTAGVRGELRIGGPVGPAQHLDERLPLLVGSDRQGEPALEAGCGVKALWCDAGGAVAVAFETVAVGAELDDELGRGVERALDHGHLELTAFAGGVALGETDQ